MRIAYLILAHSMPNQLKRLVNRLNCENVSIFIHIDKKVENIHEYAAGIPSENVYFIKERISTNWGAFSIIEATLSGLEEIINNHGSFDYISLLSGTDYPIKKNEQIMNFFINYRGYEFLHCRISPSPEIPGGGTDRYEYYHNYDMETVSNEYELVMKKRGIKRKFIDGMVPCHGSQWWSLTGDCIRYIINFARQNHEFTNYYRYTRYPDEQFFQTIIMNSGFANHVFNDNLRYIDWSRVDYSTVDWVKNPPHPKILTASDLLVLLLSDKLFARKFDENIDRCILDTLDAIMSY